MDEAAAAYRRFQEEEHTRRVLAQISERPCGMTRTRTFEEARERYKIQCPSRSENVEDLG